MVRPRPDPRSFTFVKTKVRPVSRRASSTGTTRRTGTEIEERRSARQGPGTSASAPTHASGKYLVNMHGRVAPEGSPPTQAIPARATDKRKPTLVIRNKKHPYPRNRRIIFATIKDGDVSPFPHSNLGVGGKRRESTMWCSTPAGRPPIRRLPSTWEGSGAAAAGGSVGHRASWPIAGISRPAGRGSGILIMCNRSEWLLHDAGRTGLRDLAGIRRRDRDRGRRAGGLP